MMESSASPRITVRAVIVHQGGLVLIKRTRADREPYYIFPGGGVEKGETNEQAVIREVKEETGIDINVDELFMEYAFDADKGFKKELFYRCTMIGGQIGTGAGPEFQQGSGYDGTYQAMLIPFAQAIELPVLPEQVMRKIMQDGDRV